jgi:hypothetical protein
VRITERDFSRVAHVADGQFGRVRRPGRAACCCYLG